MGTRRSIWPIFCTVGKSGTIEFLFILFYLLVIIFYLMEFVINHANSS